MKTRRLGTHGPQVGAIGLGCMPMSSTYGQADDEVSIKTIHRAIDLGVTLLDTADVYGHGHNEELVGKALKGRRDEVILATKFGILWGPDHPDGGFCGRPDYVRSACERSLARLGVDHIDLYQQHRVDPQVPIEETIGAMAELVQEGKIRYLGMSEALPSDLRRAAAVHPVSSLQSEYSLLERSVEQEVLPSCEELGIGFLPFSPLLRGLLAGSLTDMSKLEEGDLRLAGRFPRVGPEHADANIRLATVVMEIADEHEATPSQVALAWLLVQRPWIVPIPGTKRVKYIEQNAAAPELELTTADLERLEALSGQASGDRYGADAQLPDWTSPPLEA